MAKKVSYDVNAFLKDATSTVAAARRDLKSLKGLGYTPKDFARLVAAKKSVENTKKELASERATSRLDHAHLTALREDGFRLITHFRDLVHISLRGGDFPTPMQQQEVQLIAAGANGPEQADPSVEAQGTIVLRALNHRQLAAAVKKRGWSAKDTQHLYGAVEALKHAHSQPIGQLVLDSHTEALAQALSYVRTVAHVAFKGTPKKLEPYRVSKKAADAIGTRTSS